ncbi:MAG: tRNA 4-thiouridine(8) synthase ThiI [bacterium]|jgi:thiamine biosynthesis protein ThiI|nr:tRNA 4-thiouridine(8) synthase ThiI [bacterium]
MSFPTSVIACTYSEIALKGRNRTMFLRKLINNMQAALKGLGGVTIHHVESRLLVRLRDESQTTEAATRLHRVFGLQWVSPAIELPRAELDAELAEDLADGHEPRLTQLCSAACQLADEGAGNARNFRIHARRSDHGFGLNSLQIGAVVGAAVHHRSGLPGRMVDADFVIDVLVLRESVLAFALKEQAFGGLPATSSGRTMVLLSGGIDSPVAAWMMMRRGSRADFVHFYSGRNVEEADCAKIEELVRLLARWMPIPLHLHLVPVVPYETRAIGTIDDRYDMVMFRRFMVRTAARLARRHKCLALVTGDSLGQVASQTLHNLAAISPDVSLPILRPLVGLDKHEITAWSQRTGLFNTSILPYRDCCSIRSPRPILNARGIDLLRLSEAMGLEEAVREAADAAVRRVIGPES